MKFTINDSGSYNVAGAVTESEIIEAAKYIIGKKTSGMIMLNGSEDTKDFITLNLSQYDHEVFGVIFLDNQHKIICFEIISHGTIDYADIYPREVAKRALLNNASAIIVAHNHPSGDPTPSQADIAMTKNLRDAVKLLEVRLLDHIITGSETISMAERGDLT